MKLKFKQIKIPTLVGLLVLLVGLAVGVYFVQQSSSWLLRASPESKPKQVKITNITDNSFSVSWITDEATSGFLRYSTDNNFDQLAKDDRDQLSGKVIDYQGHHVTVKGLTPTTDYLFKIGSGKSVFDNNGQPFEITTAPTLAQADPASDVAYGNVIDQVNNPVEGAIVYLSLNGATPLSTITKSSGNWVIPLNTARSEDLTDFATYDKDASIEDIFVQAASKGFATAIATTSNDNPLPTIKLGTNHDFRTTGENPIPAGNNQGQNEENPPLLPTPEDEIINGDQTQLIIINPSQGEELNAQRPEFLGTAPTNQTLTITIESDPIYSGTIQVDESGNWSWEPPGDLEPGEHTITVSLTDGTTQSKTFTVLAQGASSLPALTSTPSAETSPSATPTPTLTPTPTPTTIATRSSMPSTASGVPEGGVFAPTLILISLGLSLITVSWAGRKLFLI